MTWFPPAIRMVCLQAGELAKQRGASSCQGVFRRRTIRLLRVSQNGNWTWATVDGASKARPERRYVLLVSKFCAFVPYASRLDTQYISEKRFRRIYSIDTIFGEEPERAVDLVSDIDPMLRHDISLGRRLERQLCLTKLRGTYFLLNHNGKKLRFERCIIPNWFISSMKSEAVFRELYRDICDKIKLVRIRFA